MTTRILAALKAEVYALFSEARLGVTRQDTCIIAAATALATLEEVKHLLEISILS
jgi:hypothetical protein